MKKKYQVFVSSTYSDLKEERLEAVNALLDMECIPVGMEQFPASPLSQWEYIKRLIDMSDYYLLIIAGKYGTINCETNLSYTETEYLYAKEKGIPIIAFLHKDPLKLPASKYAATDEERENIERFRNNVKNENRLVDFYENVDQLKYAIAKAMPKIINDVPAIGWVRADQVERVIKESSGAEEIQTAIDNLGKMLSDKLEKYQVSWEPISKEEIEALFDNELPVRVPNLSLKAQTLLYEACKDANGQIICVNTLEGICIQTNQKDMISDRSAREISEWEFAIQELIKHELVKAVGYKNEIYQVSKLGYEVNDVLDSKK